MFKKLFVVAAVAASAAMVSPAFASSGYGPAPQYNPIAGAPSSQRGQSALTVQAEQAVIMASADVTDQSYGGMRDSTSQSGARVSSAAPSNVLPSSYSHH